jgi:hypothetical protein
VGKVIDKAKRLYNDDVHGGTIDEATLEKHLPTISEAWKKGNYPPQKEESPTPPKTPKEKPAKVESKPAEVRSQDTTPSAAAPQYKPKRSHATNPDTGIVGKDEKGNKVTKIDQANGERVSKELGDLLPQAYDRQRLFDQHSKQEATLPQMYSWLKQKVPSLTMADLHDALMHEWSKGNITLQVHNEVGQLKDPDAGIWRNGLNYNWINAKKWIGGKRPEQTEPPKA